MINATIKPAEIKVTIQNPSVKTNQGTPVARAYEPDREPYEGSYEITPSASAVTLAVAGKRMTDDLVIEPIPNNYGLITWDGTIITVS